ncbi:hypothetical protein [Heyndrickxia camelliae]|uniref:Uncharacterized protein n=1 Tax=Heyndrickxia camelliae TaxID=1707093 RepID=A0A2N3LE62_9BACI|nr:hypothetical protein [Heyndrickxia camelliae]PKR82901.1 hypothetical protein CWO92_22180 [Heyndrickxia camelliae]
MKRVNIMSNRDFENGLWENEYDEYEEVYQNALMTVQIIEENRRLKRENTRLQKDLRESRENLDKQYQYSISQVGNILGTLIENSK